MATFTEVQTFFVEICCECGVAFALPLDFQVHKRNDGGSFYCPNGHSQHYTESAERKLKQKLDQAEQKLANAQFELLAAEKRVIRLERRGGEGGRPQRFWPATYVR